MRKWILTMFLFVIGTVTSSLEAQCNKVERTMEIIKHRKQCPNYVLVAAHRGYWAEYPENSLRAYDMAIELGADMVEIDIRLTHDDVLVVFHDPFLNRVTDGKGVLRNVDWDFVKSLRLKNNLGELTDYRVLSLSEALDYLKDKIVIDFDIKESGKLFNETMIRVIQMLKEKNMLGQAVIKGKLRLSELQTEVLDKAGVTLDDFVYTPVAHPQWQGIEETLSEYIACGKIYAMEIAYQQSHDILLPLAKKCEEAGIWHGMFTIWPETKDGVIAVKKPLTNCETTIRKYDFQDKNPQNFLDDGRGDWDWVFRHGANFIISDRSEILLDYLVKSGRRKLDDSFAEVETKDWLHHPKAVAHGKIKACRDRKGNTKGAVRFNKGAYLSVPNFLKGFDYREGFSISFWIKVEQNLSPKSGVAPWNADDPICRQFLVANSQHEVMLGAYRRRDRVVVDRYVKGIDGSIKNYGIWYWNPMNFTHRTGWYQVFLVYRKNSMTTYLFYPNGHMEGALHYMGIQDLSTAAEWIIGSKSSPAQVISDFMVYPHAFTEMEVRERHELY